MSNVFFISIKATIYKKALIINLVILFVIFCAFEPIDLFFQPIGFLFNLYAFFLGKNKNSTFAIIYNTY